MPKKIYKLIQNPETKRFLRNREVFCPLCFENFGDEFTLNIHRKKVEESKSECINPREIPLTPQKNFDGAVVWRVTF
jgi:hypothetical protein